MQPGPALRFVVLGALIFAAEQWWVRVRHDTPDRPRIVLSAADIDALRREVGAQTGTLAEGATFDGLVRAAVDDEILVREAQARDFDATDSVVRRRLVHDMRFAGGAPADDAALYRDARALGLDRSDLVVRRRLIERMRAEIESAADTTEPTAAEVDAYLAAHAAELALPARIRLSHVFLDPRARGPAVAADAARILARLRDEHLTPTNAVHLGDALPIPASMPVLSEPELAAQLGPELAAGAMQLPLATWSEPLRSAYGLHLVWVDEQIAPTMPPRDLARATARERILHDRRQQALTTALATWRQRYVVVAEQ